MYTRYQKTLFTWRKNWKRQRSWKYWWVRWKTIDYDV